LERPTRRWEDIKVDLEDTGERVWIGFMWLNKDRSRALVKTEMGLLVP
jgi:hypothetical protein